MLRLAPTLPSRALMLAVSEQANTSKDTEVSLEQGLEAHRVGRRLVAATGDEMRSKLRLKVARNLGSVSSSVSSQLTCSPFDPEVVPSSRRGSGEKWRERKGGTPL